MVTNAIKMGGNFLAEHRDGIAEAMAKNITNKAEMAADRHAQTMAIAGIDINAGPSGYETDASTAIMGMEPLNVTATAVGINRARGSGVSSS